MTKDELPGKQTAVDKPAKLGSLFGLCLCLGGLQVVGLVQEVKLIHERLLHQRLLIRTVEGGGAVDHHAQEGGRPRLPRGPVEKLLEPLALLAYGDSGSHPPWLIAVDETDAGFELGAKLGFIERAARLVSPAVVEIIGGGDPVLQMIQRAKKTEPVKVLRGRFESSAIVNIVDPREERLIGSEAAICGLPKMAVGGNETRYD